MDKTMTCFNSTEVMLVHLPAVTMGYVSHGAKIIVGTKHDIKSFRVFDSERDAEHTYNRLVYRNLGPDDYDNWYGQGNGVIYARTFKPYCHRPCCHQYHPARKD